MKARARQDALLRHMRRRGSTTIAALVQDLGASRRTILRDLAALRADGVIIDADPGRGGGLSLDPGSVQTRARLSVAEVFALILGISAMRAAGNLPFSGLADAGLAKIERALPGDRIRDLRRLLDCLYVGPLAPGVDRSNLGPMDPALLPAFETTFLERRELRFGYRDAAGVDSSRQVEPQAMLILPPLWYLVAWDPARDGFRHFRMDRIRAPQPVDSPRFRRRPVSFEAGVEKLRLV